MCRELSRVVARPARPERRSLAPRAIRRSPAEGERERLHALAARFSREDLLRAFDLLTRAENEIRSAAQPRYHLEMALLRWIYLRKLVPIEDLIASAGSGSSRHTAADRRRRASQPRPRGRTPPRHLARASAARRAAGAVAPKDGRRSRDPLGRTSEPFKDAPARGDPEIEGRLL